MTAVAAPRPTWSQVVLGLFISWQFLFLPISNYLAIFPHGQPEEGELSDCRSTPDATATPSATQKVIDWAASITDSWAYATGQVQAWWLFAPEVPNTATFPIVELRWDESEAHAALPPVRLRTTLEPSDSRSYFRPPSSFDRLFHYEVRLGLVLLNWNEQTQAEYPEIWRSAILQRVRRQWRSTRAYLHWYVQQFAQEHPELPPPTEAMLFMRIYRTPTPAQARPGWDAPVEQPLARWKPEATPPAGVLPVEAFDPVIRRFVTLAAKD